MTPVLVSPIYMPSITFHGRTLFIVSTSNCSGASSYWPPAQRRPCFGRRPQHAKKHSITADCALDVVDWFVDNALYGRPIGRSTTVIRSRNIFCPSLAHTLSLILGPISCQNHLPSAELGASKTIVRIFVASY